MRRQNSHSEPLEKLKKGESRGNGHMKDMRGEQGDNRAHGAS